MLWVHSGLFLPSLVKINSAHLRKGCNLFKNVVVVFFLLQITRAIEEIIIAHSTKMACFAFCHQSQRVVSAYETEV